MTTIGDFLVEKMQNMHKWLQVDCEGYSSLTTTLETNITPTKATCFAEVLLKYKVIVYQRDWYNLLRVKEIPTDLVAVLELVRQRVDLHDKFWRYLELFVESVSSD